MSIINLDSMKIEEGTFIIIDFETVTPKGVPPEPIEIGAMRVNPGLKTDTQFKIDWLMNPPDFAPITFFDTRQTGISDEDVKNKPPANIVLKEFDKLLQDKQYIIVAQNARYEAAIIRRYSKICQHVSSLPFIDTIQIAKYIIPNLPNYKLDTLAKHFSIPIPLDRHRALPDVDLTVKVFNKLLSIGSKTKKIVSIRHLKQIAMVPLLKAKEQQQSLFDF